MEESSIRFFVKLKIVSNIVTSSPWNKSITCLITSHLQPPPPPPPHPHPQLTTPPQPLPAQKWEMVKDQLHFKTTISDLADYFSQSSLVKVRSQIPTGILSNRRSKCTKNLHLKWRKLGQKNVYLPGIKISRLQNDLEINLFSIRLTTHEVVLANSEKFEIVRVALHNR